MNQIQSGGRFASAKISVFLIVQPILAALAVIASRFDPYPEYIRGSVALVIFCICTVLALATFVLLRVNLFYARYESRFLVLGALILENVLVVFSCGHYAVGLFLMVPILSQCYQSRSIVRVSSIVSGIFACLAPLCAYVFDFDKFLVAKTPSFYTALAEIVVQFVVMAALCCAIIVVALFNIRISNYQSNLANLVSTSEKLGVLTREQFQLSLKHQLNMNPNVDYNIIATNVKNFRLYNDLFGYEAGDQLLRRIAEILTSYTGNDGLVGRLNDDHLVALIVRDKFDSEYLHKRFFRTNELSSNKNYTVDVVFGVYEIADDRIASDIMCDRALMAASSNIASKEGVAMFREAMLFDAHKNKEILNDMLVGLAENQFAIYLQAQCNENGEMICAEVLSRWIHPERGIILPSEFIPICEEYGYITQLDRQMWNAAGALLHHWDEKGYPVSYLSVNVSVIDLYNMDIYAEMNSICKKYELTRDRLHLEITESAMMNDTHKVFELIEKLRRAGFIVEIDDFGAGYSSLGMLSQFNFDYIKLDVSFVRRIGKEPNAEKVLKVVAELARDLETRVIVEGVETKEVLDKLRQLGFDCFQGFYFSRPLSVQSFEKKYFNDFRLMNRSQLTLADEISAEPDENEPAAPVFPYAGPRIEPAERFVEAPKEPTQSIASKASVKKVVVHKRKWMNDRAPEQGSVNSRKIRR